MKKSEIATLFVAILALLLSITTSIVSGLYTSRKDTRDKEHANVRSLKAEMQSEFGVELEKALSVSSAKAAQGQLPPLYLGKLKRCMILAKHAYATGDSELEQTADALMAQFHEVCRCNDTLANGLFVDFGMKASEAPARDWLRRWNNKVDSPKQRAPAREN